MFFHRQALQRVADKGLQQIPRGILPKWLSFVLDWHQRGGDSDDVLLVPALTLHVVPDKPQGVIPPGRVQQVCKIQLQQLEPTPLKDAAHLPPQGALAVRDNKRFLRGQQVGQDVAPGLAAACGADNQVMVGEASCPGVVAGGHAVRQDTIAGVSHALLLSIFSTILSARPKATASSAPKYVSLAVTL